MDIDEKMPNERFEVRLRLKIYHLRWYDLENKDPVKTIWALIRESLQ